MRSWGHGAGRRRWLAFLVCLPLLLGSCSNGPKIPVRGELWGTQMVTTVDAEVVKYYVESYLAGKNTDSTLHAKISALHARYPNNMPGRQELADISKNFSVDFAGLFLTHQLMSEPCNKRINALFQQGLRDKRIRSKAAASSYTVLFVPGWDYAENGRETGADFRRPRELASQVGFETHLVPIPPTGSVEDNARFVAQEIHKHAAEGKQLLVVGASSAGPAIHLALSELKSTEAIASVKAWLNFGGILQGSPLVDFVEDKPWLLSAMVWFMGWDRDAVLSMGTRQSRERFARLRIPPSVLVINYLGIPMSGQLSRFGKDKYPLLTEYGPNDGLTLLADAIPPNSLTILALGSDHFFAEDPHIDAKTESIMGLMLETLSALRSRTPLQEACVPLSIPHPIPQHHSRYRERLLRSPSLIPSRIP